MLKILTALDLFRFSVSKDALLPMSFNLASLHPRLLQQHVHRLMRVIDDISLSKERIENPDTTVSGMEHHDNRMQAMTDVQSAKSSKRNAEQMEAVAKILLWYLEMDDIFKLMHGTGNGAVVRELQNVGQKSSEMRFIFSLRFFVCGVRGTGKALVLSLISLALKEHSTPERASERCPTDTITTCSGADAHKRCSG